MSKLIHNEESFIISQQSLMRRRHQKQQKQNQQQKQQQLQHAHFFLQNENENPSPRTSSLISSNPQKIERSEVSVVPLLLQIKQLPAHSHPIKTSYDGFLLGGGGERGGEGRGGAAISPLIFILILLTSFLLLFRRTIAIKIKLKPRQKNCPNLWDLATRIVLYGGILWKMLKQHFACDDESKLKRQTIFERISAYFLYAKLDIEFQKGLFNIAAPFNIFFLQRLHHERKLVDVSIEKFYYEPGATPSTNRRVSISEAERIMKLATAIYGKDIVNAARVNSSKRRSVLDQLVPVKNTEESICQHAGVCNCKEILAHYWSEEEEEGGVFNDVPNYLVFVDHGNKQVILSIRGTLSTADILVDLEAYALPFAGGFAHAGMAKVTRALWQRLKGVINHKGPQDYELIITGQSLGAGVASLLTIMIVHEKLLASPSRRVHCLAYAPPPTFYETPKVQNDPLSHITAYINNDDIVPFLSSHNVRRLNAAVSFINEKWTSKLRWNEMMKAVLNRKDGLMALDDVVSTEDIVQTEMKPVPGAPRLSVAGREVIWMLRKEKNIDTTMQYHHDEKEDNEEDDHEDSRDHVGGSRPDDIPSIDILGNDVHDGKKTNTKNNANHRDWSSFSFSYEAHRVDPQKLRLRGLIMCRNMLWDHMPYNYEVAFESLRKGGDVAPVNHPGANTDNNSNASIIPDKTIVPGAVVRDMGIDNSDKREELRKEKRALLFSPTPSSWNKHCHQKYCTEFMKWEGGGNVEEDDVQTAVIVDEEDEKDKIIHKSKIATLLSYLTKENPLLRIRKKIRDTRKRTKYEDNTE